MWSATRIGCWLRSSPLGQALRWPAPGQRDAWGTVDVALVVGLLLLSGVLFNISMLPYPMWFKIVNVIVIPLAIVSGVYLSSRRALSL